MLNSLTPLSSKAIAFIDAAVPDPQILIDGVIPETEVIQLESNRNSLEQIAEALQGEKFSIIHIIAHGQPGCLQLGNVELSWKNLSARAGNYAAAVQAWAQSLTPNAEILLYGCNVGQGNIGQAFVNSLSQLTGASVAASENLTGCAAKGGDWELTVTAGTIKAAIAFGPEAIAAYGHVLNTFSSGGNFNAGTSPSFVATGDFNTDGILDLAVANPTTNRVSILLGNGQGGFNAGTDLTSVLGQTAIAVGNFNGDNFSDLAITSAQGVEFSSIYIFLGSGNGNFNNPAFLTAIENPSAIAVGNFNADDLLDIAITQSSGNGFVPEGNVGIYLGTGQGGFATPVTVNVGQSPSAIAAGDLNGDNFLDIAVANQNSNNITILSANGQGIFGNPTNINVGQSPSAIAVGDLNGDNFLDIAVANSGSNSISILFGTENGSFGNPTNINVGLNPSAIKIGDFNGDSRQDLAVSNSGSNNVSILAGNGSGGFSSATNFSVGTNPSSLAIANFNADDRLDIAVANRGSNNVSVLLNSPNTINFGTATFSGTEGDADTVVNIPVTISGGTPFADVIVPIVSDTNSSATQNSDYTLSPTSLTFPAGGTSTEQNIAVTIKPDNIAENAETVILNFGTIAGGIAGTTNQATLTIPSNGTVSYAVAAAVAAVAEGNTGTVSVTFTVTRSGGIGAASSVNYAIAGTATNGSDYNNIGGTSGATDVNGTVNFAAGETSKTITLDVLGDSAIEPDETISVTLSNPIAPGPTPTITTATATTTITNDDTAGILVNPNSGLTTTEAGGTATFTVRLNSQPTANVTVGLSSSNVAEGTVSTPSLTFTPANWSAPQTVTVTGVDDNIADGNQTYNIFTAEAVSTDSNYSNFNSADVSVTNSDNETPGITVNPTAGLTTTEAGGTANFSVVLNTQPTAPVTVALSSSNPAEGTVSTNSLSFTPNNWNQAQTVTVTGVGDNIADGDIAYTIVTEAAVSTDSKYSNFNPSDVSVTNSDSDTVGVTVNPASTAAAEGGATGSYKLQLNSRPTAPVTVSFDGGNQISALAPISFDATNWNIAQTVTVIATDDTVVEGTHTGTINHAVTSTDVKYSGIAIGPVTVAITDNETTPTPTPPTPTPPTPPTPTPPTPPTPTPTPPTPTPPTPPTPTPTPPTPTPTPPTPTPTPPTPTPTPTPPTPTPPTPPTPTPTPTPPTPTPPTPPTPTPTPTPPTPTPLPPVIMPPTIPAGITVDPTSGLVTTEAGGKATFTVKLNTPPTADVRIDLESSNPVEGIISPPSLNFNLANWNQTQTVTVTGVDDKVVDGDQTYRIVTQPAVSNDRNYSGLNAADAIAVSIDNDRSNDNGGQLPPIDPVTGSQYKPGELLVKLRPGASNDFLGNFQANGEIALENLVPSSSQFDFTPSPLDRWRIVKFSSELDLLQIQENLARDPNVEAVELNYQGSYDFIPNDTRFSELWGLNNTGLEGGTSDADIDASEAWDSQTGDRRIIVAVTDSGVDYNHEDLIANIWTNSGEIPGDGIDNDGNGYTDDVRGYDLYNNDNDPSDDLGHGTHVAGTIGATGNNRIGVTGINHNVSLMPLKIGSRIGPDLVSITRGIRYATTKGADVINASWRVPNSRALFDAISEANSAGVLFVAAAGNSSSNNDITPSYPANYDLPNVISVAATDRNDQLAFFSNFGASTVDLGAPGRSILSTVPGNNYGFSDGTSMAAPHVAGAAALLLAQDPTLTVAQLRNSILSTVDPLPSLAGRTVSGGRLNLRNVLNPVNRPPFLNIPFREQGLSLQPGSSPQLQFTFQNDTFIDPDRGDTLTYTADWYENVTNFEWRNVSGGRSPLPTSWSRISPLPTGMSFDPASRTFRVDDSLQRNRNYWIRVTARDADGASDIAFFDLYNRGRGSVIDGYIAGATVFLDANKNGEPDASEPSATTGPKGEYELDISLEIFDKNRNGELDPEEGNIVAFGGIDTATGLPLETPVTAPPYATVVTLLTTLVANLIDRGIDSDRAESLVKSSLSIPANVDITGLDPIAATENAIAGGVETLTAMVKVQNVITQTAALIDGASILDNTDTVKAVVSAIVQQIQSGTTFNLSDPNQLATIVDRAATAAQQFDSDLNTQQLLQIAPDAAKVMAEANQRVDRVVSNTATASVNREVARVQKVALGETSADLKAVGTGTKSIAQVIAENTGTALDTKIQQTTLPDTPAVAVIEGEIDAIAANSNLTGTDGDDNLSGDSGSDTIAGKRGNDTLSGVGGNDWIHGNQGNDSLDGGDGNDTVYGGKESDNLFGNNGEDILFGNRGQDSLSGGEGNDSLYGGQASDILLGGNGSDFLSGENGDDSLIGGNGSDRFLISANSGSDIIFDFEPGIDFFVLAENLTVSQLSIIPSNSATLISLTATGEFLAALNGVTANQISINDFS
ncbi:MULTISPECIES: S8 family serine peptidase [unclassified Microcoleus]|uniref:S8 family serine peptidase n=1 Tax=unclassified Microcoleus TaxID=2642155 RepID=UPI002FD2BEFB